MREVTFEEASATFLRLVDDAEVGETTIITRNGCAVVKLSPISADFRKNPERRATSTQDKGIHVDTNIKSYRFNRTNPKSG